MEYKVDGAGRAPVPKDIRALEVLQMAYRGELKLLATTDACPRWQRFPSKPRALSDGHRRDVREGVRVQLEKAIARSTRAKLIEGKALPQPISTAIRSSNRTRIIVSQR